MPPNKRSLPNIPSDFDLTDNALVVGLYPHIFGEGHARATRHMSRASAWIPSELQQYARSGWLKENAIDDELGRICDGSTLVGLRGSGKEIQISVVNTEPRNKTGSHWYLHVHQHLPVDKHFALDPLKGASQDGQPCRKLDHVQTWQPRPLVDMLHVTEAFPMVQLDG